MSCAPTAGSSENSAQNATPALSNPLAPTLTPAFAPSTEATTTATIVLTPNAVVSATPTMANLSTSPTASNVASALNATLERAVSEMRAAQGADTLEQAKGHAETAVNVLVGKFGRWYGDQDGDGKISDPSDGRGVLPGEKSPVSGGANGDAPPQFPFGLALLAAGRNPNTPQTMALLGDVTLWRTKPRAGYDAIANAVARGDVAGLQGAVPRAVAFGRLILTSAHTLDAAHTLAGEVVRELESAMR